MSTLLRIGIISPLWKPLPPERYGGTELVVSQLVEGLVKRGHKVIVFASGDSKTSARIVAVTEKNLYDTFGSFKWDNLEYDILEVEKVARFSSEFDVLHNHNGFVPLVITPLIKTPMITTLHSSLSPQPESLAKAFKDRLFVSISNAQRNLAPYLNYIKTVYHGIDIERFPFSHTSGDYLLFLGTFSPYKGPDIAIRIARELKIPIVLTGEIRKEFEDFYRDEIASKEDGKDVIIKGEINFEEKVELLKNAMALLMPVRWQEAFGLVMIEAMACGTPVIGFNRGAIPEIIEDGKTGFVVNSVEKAEEAVLKIHKIDRTYCRKMVNERFSLKRMVDEYESLYKELIVREHRAK
ncbi:MAG: glycosyltransferase family 4 protein [Thermodesulfovibrionia bacterium]